MKNFDVVPRMLSTVMNVEIKATGFADRAVNPDYLRTILSASLVEARRYRFRLVFACLCRYDVAAFSGWSLFFSAPENSSIARFCMDKFKQLIRSVPDFPKKGILFYDITTLLKNAQALKDVLDELGSHYRTQKIDLVVGIESRGFIFAPALACQLGAGFVPVRKPGKLPAETIKVSYDLEYGKDTLEIHKDAIQRGQRVLVVDDLLATGGTAAAVTQLIRQLGGEVAGLAFLVELDFLNGRKKLDGCDVFSLLRYQD